MVGAIHLDQGEFAQGIAALEETARLGDQSGAVVATFVARRMLALFYGQIGMPHQGIALLEPLIPQVQGRDIPYKAWGLATLGYLEWQIGNTAQADGLIERAKHGANLNDLATFVPAILAIAEGEPALARGEYDRVIAIAAPLIDRFETLKIRPFKSDVMLLAAKALRGKGNLIAACEMLTRAQAEAEAVGNRRTLWQILAELAGIEIERGNFTEAQALLAQARTLIEYIADRHSAPQRRTKREYLPIASRSTVAGARVFGCVHRFATRVASRCLTAFQNSLRDSPLPALILCRDLFSNACKCGERARSNRSKSSSSSGAIKTAAVLPLRVMTTGPRVGNSSM